VGGCDVEDLGSTNGTFVDGERVSFASLRHGSALRVGSTVLRYREAGGR
jgi:pSer/pThr/pTyr-binding forkhead associated (FHA) protein